MDNLEGVADNKLTFCVPPFEIGSRIQTIKPRRRGRLRYFGEVLINGDEKILAGIELDNPTGKNDGSLDGKRYFETRPSPSPTMLYGLFVDSENLASDDFGSDSFGGKLHDRLNNSQSDDNNGNNDGSCDNDDSSMTQSELRALKERNTADDLSRKRRTAKKYFSRMRAEVQERHPIKTFEESLEMLSRLRSRIEKSNVNAAASADEEDANQKVSFQLNDTVTSMVVDVKDPCPVSFVASAVDIFDMMKERTKRREESVVE